jgi:hypothetical protein
MIGRHPVIYLRGFKGNPAGQGRQFFRHNRDFALEKRYGMSQHDIDRFEENARKLIDEAMSLSRRRLESAGLPRPKGAMTHLLQDAVIGFVGVTKLLIGLLRRGTGKA